MTHSLMALVAGLAQHPVGGDAVAIAGGLLFVLLPCTFAVIGLLALAFWIWMIVDCVQRDFPGPNDKLIWILVVVLLGWLGAVIYFFVGRPKGRLPGRA